MDNHLCNVTARAFQHMSEPTLLSNLHRTVIPGETSAMSVRPSTSPSLSEQVDKLRWEAMDLKAEMADLKCKAEGAADNCKFMKTLLKDRDITIKQMQKDIQEIQSAMVRRNQRPWEPKAPLLAVFQINLNALRLQCKRSGCIAVCHARQRCAVTEMMAFRMRTSRLRSATRSSGISLMGWPMDE